MKSTSFMFASITLIILKISDPLTADYIIIMYLTLTFDLTCCLPPPPVMRSSPVGPAPPQSATPTTPLSVGHFLSQNELWCLWNGNDKMVKRGFINYRMKFIKTNLGLKLKKKLNWFSYSEFQHNMVCAWVILMCVFDH